ncbi:hypothetical protein A2U01_0048413, partial [Trifolium medium]|nr:hypothetical protein [Trifolium medium]
MDVGEPSRKESMATGTASTERTTAGQPTAR